MRSSDCISDVCASDLDVLQPDVRRHIVDTVDRLLADHPGISYVKWDANRMITEPGSPMLGADRQANLWVDGVIALQEILHEVRHKQLGSASCRDRVCQYVYTSVVAVSFTKKI